MASSLGIALSEYARRRQRVSASLRKGIALVHAGQATGHDGPFRAHAHFTYLTGLSDEPGAQLLLDPSNPQPKRRELLFLRPRDPELERWDGLRDPLDGALRARTGFETIYRSYALPRFLTEAAVRTRRLVCVHPLASYQQPMSPDLELFRRVAERIPGAVIVEAAEAMARLRAVKSTAEVRIIERAVEVTAAGYDAVLRTLRAGLTEFDVQETLEHAYKTHGARGVAYESIAGSGMNATVLHYRANSAPLVDGDLICIDSAAKVQDYCADVTRTFPVNGRFTRRQRTVYEVVLQAEEAAIRAVRPGITLQQVDEVARRIIDKAGFGDHFPHSIGHHLGLEVHDIQPQEPLRPGAVVTIEPGIYLNDERFGIRIEDDILVTAKGRRNLSQAIPRDPDAIERLLGARRDRKG